MTVSFDRGQLGAETTRPHSRLLKCALAVEESRAYWERAGHDPADPRDRSPEAVRARARRAFEEYWFGSRSASWVSELIAAMARRFDAFPAAFAVLRRWTLMTAATRPLVCHWHLQLTDPLYRAFTGEHLVATHASARPEVTRPSVVRWLSSRAPEKWSMASRVQIASKLLSSALAAGLLTSRRDPRPVTFPRVPDDALAYVMHLMRDVPIDGGLLDNPYLRSVGLEGHALEVRLRSLPSLRFQRTGDVVAFGWRHADLGAWAEAEVVSAEPGR